MSKVIGHTLVDTGHQDHVPFDEHNPDHAGLEQIRVAEGVPVSEGGTIRVITRTYDQDTIIAHLACGHSVEVVEAITDQHPELAVAALRGLIPDDLHADLEQAINDHATLDCLECNQ